VNQFLPYAIVGYNSIANVLCYIAVHSCRKFGEGQTA